MSTNKLPVIVTITGPSASGKTVLSRLLGEEFATLVSTTTRAPREGEIEGKDYHFVSKEQFLKDLDDGKFMENVEYNGVLYGVSEACAQRAFAQGKPAVLVAEPHGVEQITHFCQDKGWGILRVFVDNDERLLLARLLNRLKEDLSGDKAYDHSLSQVAPFVETLQDLISSKTEDPALRQQNIHEFLINFAGQLGLPLITKKIEDSAQRLKSFEFEQKNWVIPARTQQLYDYLTPSFTSDVQQHVVNDILDRVHLMQDARPQKKTSPF